jgi:hypothetical protein
MNRRSAQRATTDLGDVAELADALDLGSSSRKGVQVQLLSSPLVFKVFLNLPRRSPEWCPLVWLLHHSSWAASSRRAGQRHSP